MSEQFYYACECEDEGCVERLPLTHEQWAAIDARRSEFDESLPKNREAYIVIFGHEGEDKVLFTLHDCLIVEGER